MKMSDGNHNARQPQLTQTSPEAAARLSQEPEINQLIFVLALQATNLSMIICHLASDPPDPPDSVADFLRKEYRAYLLNHDSIRRLLDKILDVFPAREPDAAGGPV